MRTSITKIIDRITSKHSERSKIVISNAIGSFLIKCLSVVVDFAKVPVLLTFLDGSHYGVYITIASILAWTHQFDFGLGAGLRFRLTKAISEANEARSKQYVSTAYISMALIMLFVLLICLPLIFTLNWNKILNCDFIGLHELSICILLVLGVFVVQFVLELISIVLQSDQKAAISTIFKPIANLLTIIVLWVMCSFAHNSLFLACIAMTIPIIFVLFSANVFYFAKKYKTIAPSFKDFRLDCLKGIYSLGFKFFLSNLSSLIVFSTASFLISYYLNPKEAAVFNTAWIYFGILVIVNTMVLQPLVSAITDAHVKGDDDWIKNFFRKIRIYSIFLTICALIMLLFSRTFFNLWVGDKLDITWELSVAMTLFFIVNIWNGPYTNFLTGVGKMNIMMLLSAIKVIIYFPIAIFFLKTKGTVGIVWAFLIVNSLPNFIISRIQYYLIINNKANGIWNK